ncbi:hypothetical protein CIG75_19210 [Tumebacillus algifaecis]|uniref:Uncharacterized protein n=1 Tax=Tumebacillus algifaecis TaxID=1214604 RepID=A0A223D5W7_9BACL|nr:hypothetical protein [Tumebacillus algifaecis]ASS76863.1 hypothetical protein CIG75_19210 [Tumebacillus algifaecis]
MGMAIYLFIWCIDRTTKEYPDPNRPGQFRGVVYGGRWVTCKEIGDEIEASADTVKNEIKKLKDGGYITAERQAHGFKIEVLNSKKWMVRKGESSLSRSGESSPSRSGESSLSEPERGKVPYLDQEDVPLLDREDVPYPIDIALDSGKDLKAAALSTQEDIETQAGGVPSSVGQEPERNTSDLLNLDDNDKTYAAVYEYATAKLQSHFLDGFDPPVMWAWIHDGIPLETIREGIDKAFAEYKPKRMGLKIKTIRYCDGKIRDLHHAKLEAQQVSAQLAASSAPPELADWEKELQRRMTGA